MKMDAEALLVHNEAFSGRSKNARSDWSCVGLHFATGNGLDVSKVSVMLPGLCEASFEVIRPCWLQFCSCWGLS